MNPGLPTTAKRQGDSTLRFMLQSVARELVQSNRLNACYRAVVPTHNNVEIWHSKKRGRAYYQNLMTCASVWLCPVCATRITENRRAELARLLNVGYRLQILDNDGLPKVLAARRWFLALATFTLRHSSVEPLVDVLRCLTKSYRQVWSGRWAVAFKKHYHIAGMFRSLEVTYGDNGWHPHIHVLFVSDSQIGGVASIGMQSVLRDRWSYAVHFHNGSVRWEYGVKVQAGDNKAGEYLDKMGQAVSETLGHWSTIAEFTKTTVKRGRKRSDDSAPGRTLWDLLAAYATGDVKAGELWLEAMAALHGKAQLMASPGLWALLGAQMPMDDDTQAQEQISASDAILARLTLDNWRLVIRHDLRGELLEIARAGKPELITKFLETLNDE